MVDAVMLWEIKENKDMEVEDDVPDPVVNEQLAQEFNLLRAYGVEFNFALISENDRDIINSCCHNMNLQRYLAVDGNGMLRWYVKTDDCKIKGCRYAVQVGLLGDEREVLEFEFDTPEVSISIENFQTLSSCDGWNRGINPIFSSFENSMYMYF